MAKSTSALYSVEKTFIWFAVAGISLLLSLILMVGQDYAREWKTWQRKFIRLKYEKAKVELHEAQARMDRGRLETLQKEEAEARKAFKAKKPEHQKIQKEIVRLEVELTKIRSRYQDLKQYQDSYRYFLEEYRRHHDPQASLYEKRIGEITPLLEKLKLEMEGREAQKQAKEARVKELQAEERQLDKELENLTKEIKLAERKLKKIKPSFVKDLLNAPLVDFLRPTLQIQQVVLEDLYDDYHFTKVQKVDRCTTCHLGIDQKGFEDAPQPFRTHPRLELFVGSNSPHPLEKFGCTVCHGGNGHSLSFKDSAHTPQHVQQKKDWEKKYRWHSLEKWAAKMLPLNHTEASCAKCHTGVVDIPQAEKLNQGRSLARTFGCFGCHKVEGFENQWKPGPSFDHIQSKLQRDWIVRWLQDPKVFRPTTHMPRIFHLANTNSPEDRDKSLAAIEGIADYLLKHSTPVELQKPAKKGDPQEGERLFKEVGCLGCHSIDNFGISTHGPNLSGMGSKTTPEWIYTWIKNPKHYFPQTRMPSLRLTEEEASHITSYLTALRNESFEKESIPRARPETVDAMALHFLKARLRHEEAVGELAKMNAEEKLVFLGEKMIAHQGCFACHDIPGFEQAKPIGTELTKEGVKEVERLDFGFVPIPRTRHDWFYQKLKDPRIFDEGKIRDYFEKLKMPQFDFTDEEASALTTFLLSLVEEPIPLEMKRRLNLREEEIEAGRFLVTKLNCQGCHLLEGKGGKVKELLPDPGLVPPSLEGEGAKVHEHWLYQFLEEPTTIRPWLKFRMPTFGFKDEELTTLVKYFSHVAKQEISFKKETFKATPENLQAGKKLFEMFQCIKCHQPSDPQAQALGASFLAPDLTLSKIRLKPNWVIDWLRDPQEIQPGTMMPTFFPEGQSPAPDILEGDSLKQIEAIRDYLMQYSRDTLTNRSK